MSTPYVIAALFGSRKWFRLPADAPTFGKPNGVGRGGVADVLAPQPSMKLSVWLPVAHQPALVCSLAPLIEKVGTMFQVEFQVEGGYESPAPALQKTWPD